GEGAAELFLAVAAVEAAMIGAQQASALGRRNGCEVTLPGVGEEMAGAAGLVEPSDLVRPAEEDAAQHEAEDALGVGHRIGEPKGAAPAAAEDDPRTMPNASRRRSMSATRSQVVFSASSACGVERPEPRWSKRTTR